MRRILAMTLLVALWGSSTTALAKAYDVADVLSAPFPDNLAASPDGSVLVWKVDASGVKNLYTNAGGSIHAITHYTTDDGQGIDSPQILPGNDGVVYLHGGVEDEAGGENPNPLQQIPPPQRAIFIVPIAGGDPVQVAEGNGVFLSPKGDARRVNLASCRSARAMQPSRLANRRCCRFAAQYRARYGLPMARSSR
jgi:hypothetical protein